MCPVLTTSTPLLIRETIPTTPRTPILETQMGAYTDNTFATESRVGFRNQFHRFTTPTSLQTTDFVLIKYPLPPYIPALDHPNQCGDGASHAFCVLFPKLNWALFQPSASAATFYLKNVHNGITKFKVGATYEILIG